MKKKKLPKYEIVLDGENLGVSFVSVVQNPAIEINWQAFSTSETLVDNLDLQTEDPDTQWESEMIGFASISNEQRMLAGPLLVPDLMIYRKDEGGKEYEVYFSKETIQLAVKKFFKSLNNLNINEEHSEKKVPGYIVESWIVSAESDKSKTFGFNLPEGTWFGVIHIEDEQYWNDMVKTKQVRGFSVEGLMSMQQKSTKEMEQFAKAETVDGVEVYTKTEGETIAVGDEVYVMIDGAEMLAPDGDHTLTTGETLVVVSGKVVEIKKAQDEEMAEEVAPVEAAEVIQEPVQINLDEIRTEFNAALTDLATRLAAVEAQLSEAKAKNAEMEEKVEKMSKFQSETPKEVVSVKKEVTLSTSKPSTNSKLAALEAAAAFRGA